MSAEAAKRRAAGQSLHIHMALRDESGGCKRLVAMPTQTQRSKIALFLPNFRIGGAERQAFELAKHLDKDKHDVFVIALRSDGGLKARFHSLSDLRVVILDTQTPFTTLLRLIGEIRELQIQILHSFLRATNVYSLLAAFFLPRLRVVIGLRDSVPDSSFGYSSRARRMQTRILDFCLRNLRYFADLFISNSEAGRAVYEKECRIRSVVISNGIDTEQFKPDLAARDLLRGAVGAPAEAKLVGILANCTAYKDYPAFVRAAKAVADKVHDVHFLSIGDDRTDIGSFVKNLVKQSGLQAVFHFLGICPEVYKLLPGLDVLCSSSLTEGFPNAIAEAMSSGVLCVVTDVGDSRRIVGDAGIVVPAGNPEALAAGVLDLLSMEPAKRQSLCSLARQRIVQNFEAAEMARRHEHLYESLLFKTASGREIFTPSV